MKNNLYITLGGEITNYFGMMTVCYLFAETFQKCEWVYERILYTYVRQQHTSYDQTQEEIVTQKSFGGYTTKLVFLPNNKIIFTEK